MRRTREREYRTNAKFEIRKCQNRTKINVFHFWNLPKIIYLQANQMSECVSDWMAWSGVEWSGVEWSVVHNSQHSKEKRVNAVWIEAICEKLALTWSIRSWHKKLVVCTHFRMRMRYVFFSLSSLLSRILLPIVVAVIVVDVVFVVVADKFLIAVRRKTFHLLFTQEAHTQKSSRRRMFLFK